MPLGQPLLATLERIGCGGIILDTAGDVIDSNELARSILQRELGRNELPSRAVLKRLLARLETRFHLGSESWGLVPRTDKRSLVVRPVQIANPASTGAHTLVILIDLDYRPKPSPQALQNLFLLSPAEAKHAVRIFEGETAAEIAASNGVKLATVRTQLASIFQKTQTHRQPELVALLARVSLLP
jgi:DNA-binding CsgD family transcriptional regulator